MSHSKTSIRFFSCKILRKNLPRFVAFSSQSWITMGSYAIWDISIMKSSCKNLRTFPDLLLFLPRLVAYFKKDYVILRSVYKEELCYMGPQYYEKFMQKFAHLPRFVAFPSQSWFTKGSFAIWDISIVKSSCINLRTFPDLLLFQYPTRPLHYPTRV